MSFISGKQIKDNTISQLQLNLSNPTLNYHAVNKGYFDTIISGYSITGHTHTVSNISDIDTYYYNKTNINTILNGYTQTGHTHTVSNISDIGIYYYTKDDTISLLGGYSLTSHTHLSDDITDLSNSYVTILTNQEIHSVKTFKYDIIIDNGVNIKDSGLTNNIIMYTDTSSIYGNYFGVLNIYSTKNDGALFLSSQNDIILYGVNNTKIIGHNNVYITGSTTFDSVAKYNGSKTFTTNYDLVSKEYVDNNTVTINTTQSITGEKTFTNNITIGGNLTVSGTTFYANVQQLNIKDNILYINSGETGGGVTAGKAGIQVDRGTLTDYEFTFNESTSDFRIGQIGNTQSVATREDNPISSGLTFWNSTTYRLVTINSLYYQINRLYLPSVGNSNGNYTNYNAGINSYSHAVYTCSNNAIVMASLNSDIQILSPNGTILASSNILKFVSSNLINFTGATIFDTVAKYNSSMSFTTNYDLVSKGYVDNLISSSGGTNINNYAVNRILTSDGTVKGINANSGFTWDTSLLSITGNISIGSSNYYYLGTPNVDGSWRFFINSNGDLEFQKRESGLYVYKTKFS